MFEIIRLPSRPAALLGTVALGILRNTRLTKEANKKNFYEIGERITNSATDIMLFVIFLHIQI